MKRFTIDDANKEHDEVRSILKRKKDILSKYKKEIDLLPKKCKQIKETIEFEITRLNHEIEQLENRSKRISELKHRLRRVGDIPYEEALNKIMGV